MRECDKSKIM